MSDISPEAREAAFAEIAEASRWEAGETRTTEPGADVQAAITRALAAQTKELARLREENERLTRERDYHKFHEGENCKQAVWFEEALGCKDMPLGTDAHEAAKEKFRDMVARIATLEQQVRETEELQKVMTYLEANYVNVVIRGVHEDGEQGCLGLYKDSARTTLHSILVKQVAAATAATNEGGSEG